MVAARFGNPSAASKYDRLIGRLIGVAVKPEMASTRPHLAEVAATEAGFWPRELLDYLVRVPVRLPASTNNAEIGAKAADLGLAL